MCLLTYLLTITTTLSLPSLRLLPLRHGHWYHCYYSDSLLRSFYHWYHCDYHSGRACQDRGVDGTRYGSGWTSHRLVLRFVLIVNDKTRDRVLGAGPDSKCHQFGRRTHRGSESFLVYKPPALPTARRTYVHIHARAFSDTLPVHPFHTTRDSRQDDHDRGPLTLLLAKGSTRGPTTHPPRRTHAATDPQAAGAHTVASPQRPSPRSKAPTPHPSRRGR